MPGTTIGGFAIHPKAASARGPCPGPWTVRRQFPAAGEDLECSWPGSVGWSAPEPPVRRLPAVGLPRRTLTWATAMTGWGSTSPSGAVRNPETVGRDHRRSG